MGKHNQQPLSSYMVQVFSDGITCLSALIFLELVSTSLDFHSESFTFLPPKHFISQCQQHLSISRRNQSHLSSEMIILWHRTLTSNHQNQKERQ